MESVPFGKLRLMEHPMLNVLPTTPWVFPEEHEYVVRQMLKFGLIKMDPLRKLPLKSGGTTDIYIDLRSVRNNPEAADFFAMLYARALQRLNLQRFVELPEALSGLAGQLSSITRLPYITIREEAKIGRAGSARIIGSAQVGDRVALIDDVITDGESKILPLAICRQNNVEVFGIVVFVDRQQGWKAHFAERGVTATVWAGMTLHDIRYQLIKMGMMKRCDVEAEKKNPLILALDGKSWDDVLPIIDTIRPLGCILKVNDLLIREGADHLLPKLNTYGRVMADPKFYDIPTTVENSCKVFRECPPWAITVHATGGGEMIRAAKKAMEGTPTLILTPTILTSMRDDCEKVYHRLPLKQVEVLMKIAGNSGADGFVCSPEREELETAMRLFPEKPRITPGIRSPGVAANDQKRVDTPANAIANGANFIVGGRQFLGAPDPVVEIRRVLADELHLQL
jgi:orotidine-5'-phosphate decarboxylase